MRAQVAIKAGQEITTRYVSPTLGNCRRRQHLRWATDSYSSSILTWIHLELLLWLFVRPQYSEKARSYSRDLYQWLKLSKLCGFVGVTRHNCPDSYDCPAGSTGTSTAAAPGAATPPSSAATCPRWCAAAAGRATLHGSLLTMKLLTSVKCKV